MTLEERFQLVLGQMQFTLIGTRHELEEAKKENAALKAQVEELQKGKPK